MAGRRWAGAGGGGSRWAWSPTFRYPEWAVPPSTAQGWEVGDFLGGRSGPPGWARWFAYAWGWAKTPCPWAPARLLPLSPFLALGPLTCPRGDAAPLPMVTEASQCPRCWRHGRGSGVSGKGGGTLWRSRGCRLRPRQDVPGQGTGRSRGTAPLGLPGSGQGPESRGGAGEWDAGGPSGAGTTGGLSVRCYLEPSAGPRP